MHLTKPVLVAVSFLWVTAFASPINSPAILRTRGLIGGSTTDGNTKDIAGSTAAGNTVGNDNTKSNAVEGAIDSFHLDDFAGSLTARDVPKRGHSNKRQDDIPNVVAGDSDNGVSDGSDDTPSDSANDANDATGGTNVGDDATGGTDVGNDATGGTDVGNDATGGAGVGDDANGASGVERRFVARDNDGSVHDANKAVHDANKAVHDANKAVHNALHGLLHGILL